ncbi:MAG: N-acetyltransferase [Planctomycetota bacterium]
MAEVIDLKETAARCRLWFPDATKLNDRRVALLGRFSADDAGDAAKLLARAAVLTRDRGVHQLLAPIDGDTWHAYRFITHRGDRPTFFLEPDHPDAWPGWFTAAGFTPLAEYFSAETHNLSLRQPRLDRRREQWAQRGLRLRSIDPGRFDDELRAVHALSLEAFANNFLYTPIDAETFVGMYRPLADRLVPELVRLAECDGALVGFSFGVPDFAQDQRGEAIDTAVLKSLAVRPGRAWAGLGAALMEECHAMATMLGYRRVIHALMHRSNASLNLSAHYALPFRTYTLFARDVTR